MRKFESGYKINWIMAECRNCGFKVNFGWKRKQHHETVAEYEIRGGKHFLKIDGIFKEVALCTVDKHGRVNSFGEYLKVMPI